MSANGTFEEVQEWLRTDVVGIGTNSPGKFLHRLAIRPNYTKRIVYVIADNFQVPLNSDTYTIKGRVSFFLNQADIGGWSFEHRNFANPPQPDPLPNLQFIPGASSGEWPAMVIDRNPGSTDFKHSFSVPAIPLDIEADEIGLYIEKFTAGTVYNAGFVTGLRVISMLS